MAKQSKPQRGAPAAPVVPDTPAQQQAARAMMWLLALVGIAIAAGGLWMLSSASVAGKLMPGRLGLGLVVTVLGAVCCWAGLYAARHARLQAGRLKFDNAAYELISSPRFLRLLKVSGHAVGITVLASSWLSYYYPTGIAL